MKPVLIALALIAVFFVGGCALMLNQYDPGNELTIALFLLGLANVLLIAALFRGWRWAKWYLLAFGILDLGLALLCFAAAAGAGPLLLPLAGLPAAKGACELAIARRLFKSGGDPP